MSADEPSTPPAFGRIKVRVTGLVFCGAEVALLRRERPGAPLFSTVGGNVEDGEDHHDALYRELAEEIGLRREQVPAGAELIWLLDARLSRPGPTPPPRKLHLVYRLHVGAAVRAGLADRAFDELPDGGREVSVVEWHDHRTVGALPLFPPIGAAIAALDGPHAPVRRFELPPVTDEDYTWV